MKDVLGRRAAARVSGSGSRGTRGTGATALDMDSFGSRSPSAGLTLTDNARQLASSSRWEVDAPNLIPGADDVASDARDGKAIAPWSATREYSSTGSTSSTGSASSSGKLAQPAMMHSIVVGSQVTFTNPKTGKIYEHCLVTASDRDRSNYFHVYLPKSSSSVSTSVSCLSLESLPSRSAVLGASLESPTC